MRLFICDPDLCDYGGHDFEYSISIADAAHKIGWNAVVLGRRDFSCNSADMGAAFVKPTFDRRQPDWSRDFLPLIEDREITARDTVFFHSLWAHDFVSLIHALALNRGDVPRLFFLFRRDLSDFSPSALMDLSWIFKSLPRTPHLAPKVRFFCDTDELCRQYEALACPSGLRFDLLPIPFRHRYLATDAQREKITMIYLGDARREKGFHLLPRAIDEVAARMGTRADTIRFVIQSNFNVPEGEPGIKDALGRLKAHTGCRVDCIDGPLSPERYYEKLNAADIVLMPYDRQRYRYRSSGILIEALSAGKVAVVPEKTWMARQTAPQAAVVYRDERSLGQAMAHAANHFRSLKRNAERGAAAIRRLHSPENLVTALQRAGRQKEVAPDPAGRKNAILVADDWSILYPNGANTVILSQIRSLQRLGYHLHLLVCLSHRKETADHKSIVTQLATWAKMHRIDHMGIARAPHPWECHGTENAIVLDACIRQIEQGNDDVRLMIRFKELYRIEPAFIETVRATAIDVALVNYVHNVPVLEKIAGLSCPLVCELHDIQAKKCLIFDDHNAYPGQVREEITTLKRCSAAIFINHDEMVEMAAAIAPARSAFLLPALEIPPLTDSAPDRPATVLQTLAAARPSSPRQIFEGPRSEMIRRQAAIDLLMVSSANKANRNAFQWFYHSVYLPVLHPLNINLFVAGMLDVDTMIRSRDRIFVIGPVGDLAPLYRMAKAIVLPVTQGTGTAIKTLEAVGFGKAVIGTDPAFRGLTGVDWSEFVAKDAGEFAARTIKTVTDDAYRRGLEQKIARLNRALNCTGAYDASLDALIQSVTSIAPEDHNADGRRSSAAPASSRNAIAAAGGSIPP